MTPTLSDDARAELDRLIAAGLNRYRGGDVDGALSAWEAALRLAPGDLRALGYVDYVRQYQEPIAPTVAAPTVAAPTVAAPLVAAPAPVVAAPAPVVAAPAPAPVVAAPAPPITWPVPTMPAPASTSPAPAASAPAPVGADLGWGLRGDLEPDPTAESADAEPHLTIELEAELPPSPPGSLDLDDEDATRDYAGQGQGYGPGDRSTIDLPPDLLAGLLARDAEESGEATLGHHQPGASTRPTTDLAFDFGARELTGEPTLERQAVSKPTTEPLGSRMQAPAAPAGVAARGTTPPRGATPPLASPALGSSPSQPRTPTIPPPVGAAPSAAPRDRSPTGPLSPPRTRTPDTGPMTLRTPSPWPSTLPAAGRTQRPSTPPPSDHAPPPAERAQRPSAPPPSDPAPSPSERGPQPSATPPYAPSPSGIWSTPAPQPGSSPRPPARTRPPNTAPPAPGAPLRARTPTAPPPSSAPMHSSIAELDLGDPGAALDLDLPGSPSELGIETSIPGAEPAPPPAALAVDERSVHVEELRLPLPLTSHVRMIDNDDQAPPLPPISTLAGPADQLLVEIDRDRPASETPDDITRRRITRLIDRARAAAQAGDADLIIVAIELALGEAPDTAVAQKLIHKNRDVLLDCYYRYFGSLERRPVVTGDLSALGGGGERRPGTAGGRPIEPRAAFLLSRIDGMMTFDELLDVAGMGRLEACRHLAHLIGRGLVRST